MNKKIGKSLVIILLMVCVMKISALASGSYSSTYEMTGGVFSKDITATKYIITRIKPTKGTYDCPMGVILATEHWYGWDGEVKYVSSVTGGTVTHYCNGTYNIWLRNYSGQEWTGNVTFVWK